MQSCSIQLAVRGKPSAFDFSAMNDLCVVASPGCMAFFQMDGLGAPKHVIHYEQPQQIKQVKFQSGGHHIAALRGGIISLWDPVKAMRPLIGFIQSSGWITDMNWHQFNPNMIAAGSDAAGGVSVWDTRSPSFPILVMPAGQLSGCIDWCPTRPYLLSAISDGQRLLIWDVRMVGIGANNIVQQSRGGRIDTNLSIEPDRGGGVMNSAWLQDDFGVTICTGEGSLQWWSILDTSTRLDASYPAASLDASSMLLTTPTGRGVVVCKRHISISSPAAKQVSAADNFLSNQMDPNGSLGRRESKLRSQSEDSIELTCSAAQSSVIYNVSIDFYGQPRAGYSLEKLFASPKVLMTTSPNATSSSSSTGPSVNLATCHEPVLGMHWGGAGRLLPPAHSGLELLILTESALLHALRIPEETVKHYSSTKSTLSSSSGPAPSCSQTLVSHPPAAAVSSTMADCGSVHLGSTITFPVPAPHEPMSITTAPKYALRKTVSSATRTSVERSTPVNRAPMVQSLALSGGTENSDSMKADLSAVLQGEVLQLEEEIRDGHLEGLNFGRNDLFARQLSLEISRIPPNSASHKDNAAAAVVPMTMSASPRGSRQTGASFGIEGSVPAESVVTLIISFPSKFPAQGTPTFTIKGTELSAAIPGLITELNAVAKQSCSRLTRAHSAQTLSGLVGFDSKANDQHFLPLQKAKSQVGYDPIRTANDHLYEGSSPSQDRGSCLPHVHSGFLLDIARCFRNRVLQLWSIRDKEAQPSVHSIDLPDNIEANANVDNLGSQIRRGLSCNNSWEGDTVNTEDRTLTSIAADVIDPLAYRVPCPRSSGATFSALGVLVCFGGAMLTLTPVDQPEIVSADGTSAGLALATTNGTSGAFTASGGTPQSLALLPYPRTLADLLVADRMRAEQQAIEAAEAAATAERAREAMESNLTRSTHSRASRSSHGALASMASQSRRKLALAMATESLGDYELHISDDDTSSFVSDLDEDTDEGSLAGSALADLEAEYLSGGALPEEISPRMFMVAPSAPSSAQTGGAGVAAVQGQVGMFGTSSSGRSTGAAYPPTSTGTVGGSLNEIGGSVTSLNSAASSITASGHGAFSQRPFIGQMRVAGTMGYPSVDTAHAVHHRVPSGGSQSSLIAAVTADNRTLPNPSLHSTQNTGLSTAANSSTQALVEASATNATIATRNHRTNSPVIVSSRGAGSLSLADGTAGSAVTSLKAEAAKESSVVADASMHPLALASAVLPLALARPHESIEMIGATLDRQEMHQGLVAEGSFNSSLNGSPRGLRMNIQWAETHPVRASIACSSRPSQANFYQVADSRSQLLAFAYSLGPLPSRSVEGINPLTAVETWRARASACKHNASVVAQVEAVMQSRRRGSSFRRYFDKDIGCCPGGCGRGSMRAVQQMWDLLAASLDVMTLSPRVCMENLRNGNDIRSSDSSEGFHGHSEEKSGSNSRTTPSSSSSFSSCFPVADNDAGSGMDWNTSALGRSLLIRCINTMRDNDDMQTLATVICIMGGSSQLCSLIQPTLDPNALPREGSYLSPALAKVKLLRPFPLEEIESVLVTYAEVLRRWSALLQATEVMKHRDYRIIAPSPDSVSSAETTVSREDEVHEYFLGSVDGNDRSISDSHRPHADIIDESTQVILGVHCLWCGGVTGSDHGCKPDKLAFSEAFGRFDDGDAKVVASEFRKEAVIRCESCNTYAVSCAICQMSVRSSGYFCIKCGHGGHVEHMRVWFQRRADCPVGCGCRCGDLAALSVSKSYGLSRFGNGSSSAGNLERMRSAGSLSRLELVSDDEDGLRRDDGPASARGITDVMKPLDNPSDKYSESEDDFDMTMDSGDCESEEEDKYEDGYVSDSSEERLHEADGSPARFTRRMYRDDVDAFETFQDDWDDSVSR